MRGGRAASPAKGASARRARHWAPYPTPFTSEWVGVGSSGVGGAERSGVRARHGAPFPTPLRAHKPTWCVSACADFERSLAPVDLQTDKSGKTEPMCVSDCANPKMYFLGGPHERLGGLTEQIEQPHVQAAANSEGRASLACQGRRALWGARQARGPLPHPITCAQKLTMCVSACTNLRWNRSLACRAPRGP